jgi:hypothetical protein
MSTATNQTPQRDLPFQFAPADPNVQWLESLLKGHGAWMTRRDIQLTTKGLVDDRDIRALASASEWIISGQKGYKHIEHASPEESAHAANWLESQAKKMSERACTIRRNAHRRIG